MVRKAPKLRPLPLAQEFVACLVRRFAAEDRLQRRLEGPIGVMPGPGGRIGVRRLDEGLLMRPMGWDAWPATHQRAVETKAFQEILGGGSGDEQQESAG